jgi:predicted RNA-binding Zn-ribbon protein involved in translation (DUF1610 family)
MPEYIEREALKEDIKNHFKKLIDEGYVYDEIFESNAEISRIIDAQSTADVAEVKYGRWYLLDECANEGVYCTACHKKVYKKDYANQKVKSKYCPNCGAKMDKE